MGLTDRISTFSSLGKQVQTYLDQPDQPANDFSRKLDLAVTDSGHRNGWFTRKSCHQALEALAHNLSKENLEQWLERYSFIEPAVYKRVGIIMAGNIPLVGFHDFLSVLISGHAATVKLSSDDQLLLPVLTEELMRLNPSFNDLVRFTDKLNDIDAVIATGSNNSARYFEYYFKNRPHIIRKNRSSIAVIPEDATEVELKALGNDVFDYFGMGCRNISQVVISQGFDLDNIFGALFGYASIVNHHKYANNYNYYQAVYALNKQNLLENGFLLVKEDRSIHTPVSVLHYWRYQNEGEVLDFLDENSSQIQCIVGRPGVLGADVAFGQSQQPALWDYADGVDTVAFLQTLS